MTKELERRQSFKGLVTKCGMSSEPLCKGCINEKINFTSEPCKSCSVVLHTVILGEQPSGYKAATEGVICPFCGARLLVMTQGLISGNEEHYMVCTCGRRTELYTLTQLFELAFGQIQWKPPIYDEIKKRLEAIDIQADAEKESELIHKLFPEYTRDISAWAIWQAEYRRVWNVLSRRIREAGLE